MMKTTFQEYICRPYCRYFSDGEKEEMACRGAQVVHELVCSNRLDLQKMPSLRKEPSLWQKNRCELSAQVCAQCSFRAEDCDFQSEGPEADGEPCGGLILLAHLLANNLITIESCGMVNKR